MRIDYSTSLHEEAVMENRRKDEEYSCVLCGEYCSEIANHICSPKTLRKLQQTRRNNNRNNKVPTPSLATQLRDGFEMWLGEEQTK